MTDIAFLYTVNCDLKTSANYLRYFIVVILSLSLHFFLSLSSLFRRHIIVVTLSSSQIKKDVKNAKIIEIHKKMQATSRLICRIFQAVTINSMNKSNRWYVTKNLLTKEERGKEEKNGGTWGIYRPGCQRPDVLLEVLCSSQRLAVITSESFHHFAIVSLLRWRRLGPRPPSI